MTRAESANTLFINPADCHKARVRDNSQSTPVDDFSNEALILKVAKGKADLAAGLGKTFTVEELEELMHESA